MDELKHKEQDNITLLDRSTPAELYTDVYYRSCCDGYDEFNRSQGQQLPLRIMEPLRSVAMKPNSVVLDVGCGRGELIYHLANNNHQAIGLDYAPHGVKIARDALHDLMPNVDAPERLGLGLANAKQLAFSSNSIDYVFMLDVVEHLYPQELQQVFQEIYRVLKPGGQLVIHTMPNTWYYAVGYPIYRLLQRLRGQKLPPDPRDRWAFRELHVNEQNPRRMAQALKQVNFRVKVWLKSTQDYSYEANKIVRFGMRALTQIFPLKLVFCNDIFAIAQKPDESKDGVTS